MARILLLCSLLLLMLAGRVHALDSIIVPAADVSLPLGAQVEYLEDKEGALSIDAVRNPALAGNWQRSHKDILSFGYTSSAYWVRFSLTQVGRPKQYLLEIAYPVLDHVDAYVFRDGTQAKHYVMGDRQPYSHRPVDNPNFVVPLDIYPDVVTEVYLRVESSSSSQIPLTLYSSHALVEHSYETGLGQALFYGAMFVMVIYNLLIFLTIRDVSYFYYVMSVISISTLLAGIEGLTFKFLWPNVAWMNDPILVVALGGMVMFSALFFRSFLAIHETRPGLSKLLFCLVPLSALCMVGAFFLPYRLMMVLTIVIAMGGILVGFWAGLVRWRDGYHAAKFFNLAWSNMLAAGFLLGLNKLGLLPLNWFTENVAQIGASLQVLLLSFAMAHRMTYERRMRERAQKESAEAQQQLLVHQIRANQDLDRLVRERTEELEKANAKLKEISATDGLTSLMNRRAFEEVFLTEYKRAYREKYSLAILMIDLDHFKRINDQFGHPFGDLCLVKAADVIRANIRRPPDIAARYGGEEFILLLPNTDTEGAICVARNLLKSLTETPVEDSGHRLFMSASIGIAARVPEDQVNREALLKEADQNLYVAKENGRNRIEWTVVSAAT